MEKISIEPIGIIHTHYHEIKGMPVQPPGAKGVEGKIIVDERYAAGLKDLEGFSHLILLYQFHKIESYTLELIPFMDTQPHGVFATRAPKRPNKIGLSTVLMTRIEGNSIYFEGADMLDGSPLIDIKPFYPKYDNQTNVRYGWLEAKQDVDITKIRSDERFK